MWTKFLNSKWFEILSSSVIAIVVVFLAQSLTNTSNSKMNVENELKTKATYDYVDKQDADVIRIVQQHMRESARTDTQQMELIKSIDTKINILIQRSKE